MNVITEKGIIKTIVKKMNSDVNTAIEATENSYKNKVFAVVEGEKIQAFKKTKRGAESYIKKHTFSYYDEYFQDMRNVGDNYEIVQISVFDIVDYYNDKKVWFETMRNRWMIQQSNQYILEQAKKLNCSNEVIELIEYVLQESTANSFPSYEMVGLEEVEETAVNEEIETAAPTETTETATATADETTEISYRLNEEKNGIEIYFTEKPSEEIRNSLKLHGYKWSRFNKCWYAKQSDNTLAYAQSLCNSKLEKIDPLQIEIPDFLDVTQFKINEETEKRLIDNSLFGDMRKVGYETEQLQLTLSQLLEETKEVVNMTDNNYYKKRLIDGFNSFCERYSREMNKYLYTRSINPSWAVTGRGNMNVSRYNKKQDQIFNMMGKVVEMLKKQENALHRYKSKILKDMKNKAV